MDQSQDPKFLTSDANMGPPWPPSLWGSTKGVDKKPGIVSCQPRSSKDGLFCVLLFFVNGVSFLFLGQELCPSSADIIEHSGHRTCSRLKCQRLDLHSNKASGGITKFKGQAETHRFTGVKIHGKNVLSRQKTGLHANFSIFTVISRCFGVGHRPPCSHRNCRVKTCWGGTAFVESKGGNSMNSPSITSWISRVNLYGLRL